MQDYRTARRGARHGGTAQVAACAGGELEREAIGTLAPLREFIDAEKRALHAGPPREFILSAQTLPDVRLEADDGHLWIKAFRTTTGVDAYWIIGLRHRLLVKIRNGELGGLDLVDAKR